jgi:hypothetical protein
MATHAVSAPNRPAATEDAVTPVAPDSRCRSTKNECVPNSKSASIALLTSELRN